jgi:hypothetical protein
MPNNSPFTFCAWVQIVVDTNNYAQVFYKDGGEAELFFATQVDGTTFELFINGGGTAMVAMTVGVWYFVAFTRDAGAALADMYWAAAGDASLSTLNVFDGPFGAMTVMWLGDDPYAEFWNGRISKARAWQARLTATELAIEWKAPAPVRQANIVDYVPLRDASSAAVASIGTWAITGTLVTEAESPADAVSAGMMAS